MAESPIDLLTIDLLCRVICQGHMMVLANRGLLMVLQPFVGQADSESCTHYLYLDLVSSVGVCVPVAVGPSVAGLLCAATMEQWKACRVSATEQLTVLFCF